jgi:hypothetical protein
MAHRVKVVVPYVTIDNGGELLLPGLDCDNVPYFVYELHDHFEELRGRSVRQNLYLCSLIALKGQGVVLPNLSTSYA